MSDDMIVRPEDVLTRAIGMKSGRRTLEDLMEQGRASDGSRYLLIDISGSMGEPAYGDERKIDALRRVAHDVKKVVDIPMIGFGAYGGVDFIKSEIPEPQGGTPLTEGLRFGMQQGARHLIVISDGEPDSPFTALQAGEEFKTDGGKIDVCYIGPEGGAGKQFLEKLAALTGGTCHASNVHVQTFVKELTGKVLGLLDDGSGSKRSGPIQL